MKKRNRAIDLDFSECPGIDPQSELAFNLFTAIVSLRHNTYFRSIRVVKLPHINIVNAVGMVLETNHTITRVVLKDLKTEQSFVPIGRALAANPDNALTCLTLSGNNIGVQSLAALCDGFERTTHGLARLDLSRCGIRPKGIEMLFTSFERNFGLSLSLQHLDLSDNSFSTSGSIALASWLSKAKGYNALKSLVLSNCNLNFGIMGPPMRVIDLRALDLSRNRIDKAAAKLVADVLECVPTLKNVNLSECRIGWQAAEDLFQGLARNKPLIAKTGVLTFNLKNNQLGPRGGLMVARALPQLSYLGSLNLAMNRIGAKTLTEFTQALSSNNWIAALDLSGNITGVADTEALCINLRDYIKTHPNLKSLSISGTPKFGLGKALFPILEVLAGNSSLTYLNVSENNIGDVGASVIAESLRSNKGLTHLDITLNHFTFTGWTTLVAPVLFRTNTTLNHLPTPLSLHTLPNTSSEPYTSLSGEMKDQLSDLFSRLHYRLLGNLPTPPKVLREPPRPIPTQVERAADVPEHLLALAPPKSSPSPFAQGGQRLHETTETADIGGPTSKEDWGADESWEDEHAEAGVSEEETNSADEFEDDDETPKAEKGKKDKKDKKDKATKEAEKKAKEDRKEKEEKEKLEKAKREQEQREKEAKEQQARDKDSQKKKEEEQKKNEEEQRKKEEEQKKREKEAKEQQEKEEQKRREEEKERERKEKERAEKEAEKERERARQEAEKQKEKEKEKEAQHKAKPAAPVTNPFDADDDDLT